MKPVRPILDIFSTQTADAYCNRTRTTVGLPSSTSNKNMNGLLLRLSPIDSAIQKVVPHKMCTRNLHFVDHSSLGGHLGDFQMYDRLRNEYLWTIMSKGVYSTVR